ncbi:unnamed protein product [Linum trigynum]|uniref:Uncharacterized protein n=1 Tax=Linum trigynum TaxID=586398 RepID=A0AAV2FSP4_9ROSI
MEKRQSELTPETRGALVDSLVKLAEKKHLRPETLFRAVAYIDRYLSLNHRVRTTTRRRLRLLAASSMLIAFKYEEIHHLKVDDVANTAGFTFTRQEVLDMEVEVLTKLIYTFLSEINEVVAQEEPLNSQLRFMASYIAELSLLDCRLSFGFSPSLIAASAIFLSRFIIEPNAHPWNDSLQRQSGYKPAELKECVLIMHDLYPRRKRKRQHSNSTIHDKYSKDKFKCVLAAMESPTKIPLPFFENAKSADPKMIQCVESSLCSLTTIITILNDLFPCFG